MAKTESFTNTHRRNKYDHRMGLLRYCIGVALYGPVVEEWPRRF